jgi:hypothetical protein
VEGPLPTDQVNLTDEESRVTPVAGGGFEQLSLSRQSDGFAAFSDHGF